MPDTKFLQTTNFALYLTVLNKLNFTRYQANTNYSTDLKESGLNCRTTDQKRMLDLALDIAKEHIRWWRWENHELRPSDVFMALQLEIPSNPTWNHATSAIARVWRAQLRATPAPEPNYYGHDDPREAARVPVFVRLPGPPDHQRHSISGSSMGDPSSPGLANLNKLY